MGKDVVPAELKGSSGWFKVTIPMASFACGGVDDTELDNLTLQNVAERNALFCVADVKILR